MKPSGHPDRAQSYPYTPTVYHYQQVYPPGGALIKVQAFDYFAFSVLEITGLDDAEAEIQAIHMDHALPLLTTMAGNPAALARAQYPLRLAKNSSISMLLNSYPATTDRLPRWGSLLPRHYLKAGPDRFGFGGVRRSPHTTPPSYTFTRSI